MMNPRLKILADKLGSETPPWTPTADPAQTSGGLEAGGGLIIARGKQVYGVTATERYLLSTRPAPIWALCVHQGELYDAGEYDRVCETFSAHTRITRSSTINALCSHQGALFDAGDYSGIWSAMRKLAEDRKRGIFALCSHDGILYYGGQEKVVFKAETHEGVALRPEWVRALCSHNGTLYDGGDDCMVHETVKNEIVARRPGWVWSLCVHQGPLYDAGD